MRPPLLAVLALLVPCRGKQPNILFIMADDLGWNDVSWNNKAMTTPTLERLANEGIRLDQAYSQQVPKIDHMDGWMNGWMDHMDGPGLQPAGPKDFAVTAQ